MFKAGELITIRKQRAPKDQLFCTNNFWNGMLIGESKI